ncbi:hypothetical protein HYX19_04070, partial [Candidatus Woesearchaeota archaeon]|nr:hypothetical protein [Candidatus Woesearchaeota archaeon]
KETVYKENGVYIKLDVEKCYFSPRLSTERLRVARTVKDGETILVMFAGVLPYSLVISKNSNANFIYAVEANKTAYQYGLVNIQLNKAPNIRSFFGDVNKVLRKNIFSDKLIGLKSYWHKEDLSPRLKKKPKLIEFYIKEKDLENNFKEMSKTVDFLSKRGIRVMLHQPTHYKGIELTLATENEGYIKNSLEGYSLLYNLCKKRNVVGFIMHPVPKTKVPIGNLIFNLKQNRHLLDYAYIENLPRLKEEEHLRILKEVKAKNACIDLAHYFLINKSNEGLINFIKKIKKDYNTYFHLCDSNGDYVNFNGVKADCVNIGEGSVNFEKVLDFFDIGIIEVKSKNEKKPRELLKGYEMVQKILKNKKFDRIIMPLPKNASDFLPLTKRFVRKGTIVNLYDFQNKENMPKKSLDKIRKTYKKFEVLDIVKCGQISPRKYRVCVDLKVDF